MLRNLASQGNAPGDAYILHFRKASLEEWGYCLASSEWITGVLYSGFQQLFIENDNVLPNFSQKLFEFNERILTTARVLLIAVLSLQFGWPEFLFLLLFFLLK